MSVWTLLRSVGTLFKHLSNRLEQCSNTFQIGSNTVQTLVKLIGTVFKHFLDWLEQCSNTSQISSNTVWTLFKLVGTVFKHFSDWFKHCSNSLSLFGNCSNTCSKCLNISIYLCWTVCVMGVRSLSLPAFQWCLFHPNWLSGCEVIHVFVSVQTVCHCLATVRTLVQSVRTFQYICARLFALCVSDSPWHQPSNSASAIQICGLVAELFMFLDYIAL